MAVHNFLDAFYLSRIGIRMLIGQYLELRKPPKPDYIGLVCLVSCVAPHSESDPPLNDAAACIRPESFTKGCGPYSHRGRQVYVHPAAR
jgi:hypothetical protein